MTDNGDIFRERIREVVQERIGDYLPNERNPKIHGELQNERLRAILENWGKVGVLLTFKDDDGRDVVFDGHARRNQNPDETWYIAKTDLTRQEANELVLMYDPIAALATMDRAQMDGLLREVQTTDASLTAMLGELAADAGLYLGENGNGEGAAADAEPQVARKDELAQEYGTAVGQLWQLGEHRLAIGDCTDAAVVTAVTRGERADAVVTDPPYGINLDTDLSDIKTDWKGWKGQGGRYDPIVGDDRPYDPAHIFRDFGNCAEIFIWGADYFAERLPERNEGSWLVWDKRVNEESGATLSWGLGSEFEMCWSKKRHKRSIIRKLWSGLYGTETQDVRERIHPTQKPVEVIAWILEKYTKPEEVVVDPFVGSGTTIIASHNLGRRCLAVEIDPGYAAVTLQRWVDLTGGRPELLPPHG